MATKTDMLDRMRVGREQFAAQWADLSDEQLARPGMHGDWSIKDLIAHVVFWEKRMLDHVPRLLDGYRFPAIEVDELNAQVYAQNRDRPVVAVLAEFHDLGPQVVAQVEALADADLNRQVEALGGAPLLDYIEGNSYGHYEEHLDDLRAWVAQLRAVGA